MRLERQEKISAHNTFALAGNPSICIAHIHEDRIFSFGDGSVDQFGIGLQTPKSVFNCRGSTISTKANADFYIKINTKTGRTVRKNVVVREEQSGKKKWKRTTA